MAVLADSSSIKHDNASRGTAAVAAGYPWGRYVLMSVLFIAGLYAIKYGQDLVNDPAVFPVNDVAVKGDLVYLQRQDVQSVISREMHKSFFSLDLDALTANLEALPWVKDVALRRYWPDSLEVVLVERQPFAYWGDQGLVSVDGEAFFPDTAAIGLDMPKFTGPRSSSLLMLESYHALSGVLVAYGMSVSQLFLDERGSWRLETNSGLHIKLGRDKGLARMKRFLTVYSKVVANRVDEVEYVDLRYPNGFAIQWRNGLVTGDQG